MELKQLINNVTTVLLVTLVLTFGYRLVTTTTGTTLATDGSSTQSVGASTEENTVEVVDGVQAVTLSWGKFNYKPETITVKANMPVRITADMTRLGGCFRSFVMSGLGIQKRFTESDNVLEFTPTKKGTFGFSCSMGMGRGTLVVE